MSGKLSLSIAQVETSRSPQENLDKAVALTKQAASEHSELIVFPEMFMAVPYGQTRPIDFAEKLNGYFVNCLSSLAVEHSLYILAGVWEKTASSEHASNTVVVLSPEGSILTVYRKLHLFDSLNKKESDIMLAGNKTPEVFYINNVSLSTSICYDLRFPELFRLLALRGAQIILVPSAWYQGPFKENQWISLLRARAIENTIFLLGCNQVGDKFCGRSTVIDPFGVVVADLGESPGLQTVSIDMGRVSDVRYKLPVLEQRRKDIYEIYSY